MIAAYEGDLPYIFVSYAHKDSREVFDLLEKLSAHGYRIWYDGGIGERQGTVLCPLF